MQARWPALICGALLALALVWALVSDPRPASPLRLNAPAPDFRLSALDGAPVSLAEQRGRVVLLNFWATWCAPCEAEMPAMERLYREFKPRGFELLAVSVDQHRAEVVAFRERLALSFPILHDPEKRAAGAYRSYRFPESFLIDRDGTLLARYIGPREWDDAAYRGRIARLLAASE